MIDSLEIIDLLKIKDWQAVSESIREGLYEPSFPRPAEQMDWGQLLGLLDQTANLHPDDAQQQPATFLLVAGRGFCDTEQPEIAGLLLATYYPKSHCSLLGYMAVAESFRGQGVSRKLMASGKELLAEYASGLGHELLALFGEVREPHSDQDEDQFDPHSRLAIWTRHGARLVPIDYVMAPLGPGMPKVHNLNLMAFPIRHDGPQQFTISTAVVLEFLQELYQGYCDPQADPDFNAMTVPLRQLEQIPLVNVIWEKVALPCDKYGIAYHFRCKMKADVAGDQVSTSYFRDVERDLLAFTWQEQPPFRNEVLNVPSEWRRLSLVFPPSLTVERDGEQTRIITNRAIGEAPAPRCRSVQLHLSRTVFADGVCILHVVFGPDFDAGGMAAVEQSSCLSEWDIAKLLHGWGASIERVIEPDHAVTFARLDDDLEDDPEGVPLSDLVRQLVETISDVELVSDRSRHGTVQIVGDSSARTWEVRELAENVDKIISGEPLPSDPEWARRSMAVDSLLVGDFDCMALDRSELQDSLKGLQCEKDRIRGVHKGTLLEIISDSRPFDVVSRTIGISPYVLLPQAVAIYNDILQQEAAGAAHESDHVKDKQCQPFEAQMRSALQSRMLPNIFHYSDEQWYFSQMMESRGLNQRREVLIQKLGEIENRFNNHLERREKRFGVVVAVIGIFLAVIEAAGIVDSLWPGTLQDIGTDLKAVLFGNPQ